MAIAWVAMTTNPNLIDAFRRVQWDVKLFPPSEFVLASLTPVSNHDAIVFEITNALSLDMCQEVCDKKSTPMLAIVPNLAYAQAALEAGADDFLVNPVDPIEALLRVRKLVKVSNIIRVGNLEIDLAAWRVSDNGRCVQLSPVEFRLLACLAKRVGQMVSHTTILEEVWGCEVEPGGPAQVKSYVGRVRSKIEPDLRNPQYIISVPRAGYRLRNQRQWEENFSNVGSSTVRREHA